MQIMDVMNTVITVVTMVEITWRVVRHVQRFVSRRRDSGSISADDGNPLDPRRGGQFPAVRHSPALAY